MSRLIFPRSLALLVTMLSFTALAQTQQTQDVAVAPAAIITDLGGPEDVAADAVRFEAIDVFVDSGQDVLAAWQFELVSRSEGVEIVGIEGGEHAAFATPPFYDPRAMMSNRVILAAFSTDEKLPSGRTRVARIHVQLTGPGAKTYQTQLTATANTDGHQISATHAIAKAGRD